MTQGHERHKCLYSGFRRRKWQPTAVFLPGKSHGQRSLTGHGILTKSRARLSDLCLAQQVFEKINELPFAWGSSLLTVGPVYLGSPEGRGVPQIAVATAECERRSARLRRELTREGASHSALALQKPAWCLPAIRFFPFCALGSHYTNLKQHRTVRIVQSFVR